MRNTIDSTDRTAAAHRLQHSLQTSQPLPTYSNLSDPLTQYQSTWWAPPADEISLSNGELPELLRRVDVQRLVVASGSGLGDERVIDLVRAAKSTGVRVTFFPGVLALVGSSVVFDELWACAARTGRDGTNQPLGRTLGLVTRPQGH